MLNRIQKISWFHANKAAGIELLFLPDGSMLFRLAIVKKSGKRFTIEKTEQGITSFDSLLPLIKGIPVVLSIDGKGIIHKKLKLDAGNDYFNKALPGANEELFYVQKTLSDANNVFISIGRRDLIDEAIAKFTDNNIAICNVFMGPFNIANVFNNLNSLDTGFQSIEIQSGNIYSIAQDAKQTSEIQINNEPYSAELAVPYSNAVYYFDYENVTEKGVQIEHLHDEYIYSRVFKLLGIAILCFFFIILFLNFIFFSNLNNERNVLDSQNMFNKGLSERLNYLKLTVNQKQELLDKSGYTTDYVVSVQLDELFSSITTEIKIKKIDFHYIEKKPKPGEEIRFETDVIFVSGYAGSGEKLDVWINVLSKINWIKFVKVSNYKQDSYGSPGEFEILLYKK